MVGWSWAIPKSVHAFNHTFTLSVSHILLHLIATFHVIVGLSCRQLIKTKQIHRQINRYRYRRRCNDFQACCEVYGGPRHGLGFN